MPNTNAPIPVSHKYRCFGYLTCVTFKIIIVRDMGKKTDPKYEMRFAKSASESVFETDSIKYPPLTRTTAQKRRIYHLFFFLVKKRYPDNTVSEKKDATRYATEIADGLSHKTSPDAAPAAVSISDINKISRFFIKKLRATPFPTLF